MDEVTDDQTEAADVEAGENVLCLDPQRPVPTGLDVLNVVIYSSPRGILQMKLLIGSSESFVRPVRFHFPNRPGVNANKNGNFASSDVSQERRIPLLEHKHESESPGKFKKPEYISNQYHGLLITAALLAAMTFNATLRSPAIFSRNGAGQMNHLFILLNSVAFFTSLAAITLLACHHKIKPWLWIALFSVIGAYICAVVAVSPNELGIVILAGICVFIAALLKYQALHRRSVFSPECSLL